MVCFELYAASRAMTGLYRPALDAPRPHLPAVRRHDASSGTAAGITVRDLGRALRPRQRHPLAAAQTPRNPGPRPPRPRHPRRTHRLDPAPPSEGTALRTRVADLPRAAGLRRRPHASTNSPSCTTCCSRIRGAQPPPPSDEGDPPCRHPLHRLRHRHRRRPQRPRPLQRRRPRPRPRRPQGDGRPRRRPDQPRAAVRRRLRRLLPQRPASASPGGRRSPSPTPPSPSTSASAPTARAASASPSPSRPNSRPSTRPRPGELLEAAHQVCPYSNATRGNVEVTLTIA